MKKLIGKILFDNKKQELVLEPAQEVGVRIAPPSPGYEWHSWTESARDYDRRKMAMEKAYGRI